MKGISPLIATILLVGLTVAVAGLVSVWLLGFSKQSTGSVEEKANLEILCNKGGISFSDVCYSSNYISGYLTNTGTIVLGNITLQVLYDNASQTTYYLSYGGGAVIASTSCCGNLSMLANERYGFNVSANSNYDRLYVYTNCTGKVTDEIKSGDILTTC
jgi:flagellin-like protein